ncbi:hypothetical protein G6F66_010818 [Rhizopus arrhizus]|nr:hypothetical protein G6F23_012193 [Rhizopus arrhizus]KAG1283795.1 hypothetical protein G6F66_010818 [Rhizopus arrhizus]
MNKALQAMNQTAAIDVNCKGFDRLLSARFYAQIARLQLEYGLAISSIPPTLIKQFENCQKQCIRSIFRGGARSSYKAMLHLINQPTMKGRVHLLQAKFLMRSVTASEDTLLSHSYLTYACLPVDHNGTNSPRHRFGNDALLPTLIFSTFVPSRVSVKPTYKMDLTPGAMKRIRGLSLLVVPS